MSLTIFLRYADEEAARTAFQAFGYTPPTDEQGNLIWAADGALEYLGQRFDYHVVGSQGVLYHPTGNTIEVDGVEVPEMIPSVGYHVNLRWTGNIDMIPDFGGARIIPDPIKPKCLFSE